MENDDQQLQLIDLALQSVIRSRSGSTSRLMRDLHIGYREAYALMIELERRGIVTPADAAGARRMLSS